MEYINDGAMMCCDVLVLKLFKKKAVKSLLLCFINMIGIRSKSDRIVNPPNDNSYVLKCKSCILIKKPS
jgi:hypothetical protein